MLSNSPASAPHITCRTDSRSCPSNTATTSSKARANTEYRPYNCRPIPSHCDPCPGNTNTVLPTDRARPTTTPAPGSPAANPANPAIRRPRSAPTTTARWSNTDRVLTNDHPTSSAVRPSSAVRCANNRPAWLVSACGDRAANTHGTATGALLPAAATDSTISGDCVGPCSRITCAFVPPMPNDDTPARRGSSATGHGVNAVSTRSPRLSKSIGAPT
ncbi:Uncharacterised protein [Mycobacterium tuberculosis]|nr:Uncharacterised protein [Mycobacterium tuberculosis]